jgi:hypothetical protein
VSRFSAEYKIERYGTEQEPIVIIDNYSGQVAYLLSLALSTPYGDAGAGYPGLRAQMDPDYLTIRARVLAEALREAFGFDRGILTESCNFSIVTTPATNLNPSQRMPHYDDTSEGLLAALHYLKGPETGGTAFYRHKRTGFETVTPERAPKYREALAADEQEFGSPEPGYIYGDTSRFEMIADIPAKPDRLIIYRGRTLHSGVIPKDLKLTDTPLNGRVTLNTFLVKPK